MAGGAGGRPKKGRPLAMPVDSSRDLRVRARALLNTLEGDTDAVQFLDSLIDHHQALDDATSAHLIELDTDVKDDKSIAKPTRRYLRMLIARHDIEDPTGRMQIRTLLGSALIGKPPEATPDRSGMTLRLPDGRVVQTPTFPAEGLDLE